MTSSTQPSKSLLRSWPFYAALALLLVIQTVYLTLSLSSLRKFQLDSERRLEQVLFDRLSQKLSTVIELGVPLEAYQGLRAEVESVASRAKAIYLVVLDASGKILTGQRPDEADYLAIPLENLKNKEDLTFTDFNLLWVARPIYSRNGTLEGFICHSMGSADLSEQTIELARQAVSPLTILALLFSVFLTGWALITGVRKYARGKIGLKNFYVRIFVCFLLGQAFFSVWSMSSLFKYHLTISRSLTTELLTNFAQDLNRVKSKGVELSQIGDLKRYMNSLILELPILGSLSIKDTDFELDSSEAAAVNKVPEDLLVKEPFSKTGQVWASISTKALRSVRIELSLDNLFLTLVSCLFLFELLGLLIADLRKLATGEIESSQKSQPNTPRQSTLKSAPEPLNDLGPIRPLTFAALLAMDLSLSFIPLAMAAMNPSGALIPVEVLLGLPVSIQMAMIGFAQVFGGRLAHRLRNIRPLMIGGFILAAAGSLGGALAWEPWLFTVSMGVIGLGYGTFNLTAHLYVAEKCPPDQSGEAMGELAAGMYSGSLCGCLIGGMMADRFGYSPVFFLAMVIFFLMALVWPIMLTPSKRVDKKALIKIPKGLGLAHAAKIRSSTDESKRALTNGGERPAMKEKKNAKSVRAFLSNRGVLSLFLLSILPTGVALIGLFNYFLPVHLANLGYGPSMVSRLNVLLSLVIIFLGPMIGRKMDKSSKQPTWLFGAGILAALAIPTYLVWPTLAGVILGVGLLSLSTCVTEGGHAAYLLNLKATKDLGADQALGLYSGFSQFSRMFGPIILGSTLVGGGLWGLITLGALMAVASLAFILFAEVPVKATNNLSTEVSVKATNNLSAEVPVKATNNNK
ncbi:MAG: MFS transporter [Deltaproteobacteria bacterium]|jgi:MFS family permease|nr:MFS transporter [Deltaproteobacteria bacterium]